MIKKKKFSVELFFEINEEQLNHLLLGYATELDRIGFSTTAKLRGTNRKERLSVSDRSRCVIFYIQSASIDYDDFTIRFTCAVRDTSLEICDHEAELVIRCFNYYEALEEGESRQYSAKATLQPETISDSMLYKLSKLNFCI